MTNNTLGRQLSNNVWNHYTDNTTGTRQTIKDSLKALGIKPELINKLTQKFCTYHGACWLGAATFKHYDDNQLLEILTTSCLNNPPSKWKLPLSPTT